MPAQNPLIAFASDSAKPFGLSSHFESVLADFLEEALLAKSRHRSVEIASLIEGLLDKCMMDAQPEVSIAVTHPNDAPFELREAYIIGQLSLAQTVATTHINKKVCSRFLSTITDEANLKYIRALLDKELSNTDLADIVNHSEEHTSRKLRELRELGIIESHKMGKWSMNFLTSAALGVIMEYNLGGGSDEINADQAGAASEVFEHANSTLSPIMRQHTPLGRKRERVAA
ncbi:hypothetical protein PS838_01467 [Pseudomonas fluorescens]|nr:hypothetical protein PS838_01467 [Pseudomonas fluorescens]